MAIYYRACAPISSATGTIAGNTLSNYQKGGIVVSCAGAAVSISGNTVTGQGPVTYIAQNGIQVGYGATAQVMRNTVTGNAYSGTNNASSAGILIVGGPCFGLPLTTGVQNVRNTLDGNDVGVWLANLNADCVSPPPTNTNIKVVNNEISDGAVTNISGNGSPFGYQAGISDTGVNDKLINNSISGAGYTPSVMSLKYVEHRGTVSPRNSCLDRPLIWPIRRRKVGCRCYRYLRDMTLATAVPPPRPQFAQSTPARPQGPRFTRTQFHKRIRLRLTSKGGRFLDRLLAFVGDELDSLFTEVPSFLDCEIIRNPLKSCWRADQP